jgi:hypothetical protein
MERRLEFTRLSVIDVAESTAFYIVAVALAASGFGAWALVSGVIAKGVLTTLLIYGLSSWRPRLTFAVADSQAADSRFGVAQQLRHVAELVNAGVRAGGRRTHARHRGGRLSDLGAQHRLLRYQGRRHPGAHRVSAVLAAAARPRAGRRIARTDEFTSRRSRCLRGSGSVSGSASN